ncbi:nitroreductase [Amycolatopsis sp. lyj-112]|uniref:nitroreductase n=1 Tax=Amycolatopsis sp. lyj-112 TaxID=2789288 RepID=UPI00397AC8B4
MRQPNDPPSGEWTTAEVEVLARAAVSAPSVRNSQPWSLALPGRRIELSERADVRGADSGHDGRDRLISCGAALANLAVAVRALGWNARVSLVFEDQAPLVAVVVADRRLSPSAEDLHGYSAISRWRSHDTAFSRTPVAPALLSRIIGRVPGDVLCQVVSPGELRPLAVKLEAAGPADWTTSLIPDGLALTGQIGRETLLIISAYTDRRAGQVLVGRAMEFAWLAAIEIGVAASVLTPSVRDRLVSEPALPGFPGVIMRLGYPAE